jgi:Trypsin-like peptidase domain
VGARRRLIAAAAALAAATSLAAALAGGAGAGPVGFTLGGEPCKLIPPARSAGAVGGGACDGVRPGGVVETRLGGDEAFCTLNFLFRGSDGRRYIGTAGHCVLGKSNLDASGGERVWRPRRGPVARDGEGNPIGRFAYAVLEDPRDFALIRLRRQADASAQMCHFGGPTAINADRTAATVELNYYGNGTLFGETVPARSMVAFGMPDPDHVFAQGAASPGDSGAGVISADGRAVGVLVSAGVHAGSVGEGGVDAGAVGITRIGPQLERAAERLRLRRLQIRTAPLS